MKADEGGLVAPKSDEGGRGGGNVISQPQGSDADSKQSQNGGRLQRPTTGKRPTATARPGWSGLASPAGTGAGVCLTVAGRRDDNSPAFQCRVDSAKTSKSRRDDREFDDKMA